MLRRRDLLATAAATFAAAAPLTRALAQTSAIDKQSPPGLNAYGQRLNVLFDDFVKRGIKRNPEFATYLGIDNGDLAWAKSRTSDISLATDAADLAESERRLRELKAIDRSKLVGHDQVHYDMIVYGQENNIEAVRKIPYGGGNTQGPYILSQLSGSYQQTPTFLDTSHSIETAADAEAYLSRLHGWGDQLGQELERARHDAAMGVTPPDFAIDKALGQMKGLRDQTPAQSVVVQSIARRTKEKKLPGDWEARASKIYTDEIQPGLQRQIEFLQAERKTASHDAGVWRLPKGEEYYRLSLRDATTTDISPDEAHRMGLELVASLSAQADTLMRKQGLTQGTVGERYRHMYEDPQFRYANTDEAKVKLIADLNEKVRVVQAKLPAYFGQVPKAPLSIVRVPKYIEAGAPGGYYQPGSLDGKRPGQYYINLRDTAEVPSWTLPTLTYHEGIPGHHLQLTLQQESKVPVLIKTVGYNAYAEGWALYAENLAVEIGMYDNDPWGHIGMLHDATFRAARLVVDSGMHSKRWSREQALKYYVDNIGDQETSAITEIERYCVWPGQACSYMVGKLHILGLRDKAKKALGPHFDLRKFHDAVLLNGSLPLTVLDKAIDNYLAATTTA